MDDLTLLTLYAICGLITVGWLLYNVSPRNWREWVMVVLIFVLWPAWLVWCAWPMVFRR